MVNDRIVRWDFAEPLPEDAAVLADDAPPVKSSSADPMSLTHEGHRRLIADLIDALREGRPPMIPGAEARNAVALVLAIYEAARSGARTRISRGG